MRTTKTTDPITTAFVKANGRSPREGDFYHKPRELVTGPEGRKVRIYECWTFEDGRWEGFVSLA